MLLNKRLKIVRQLLGIAESLGIKLERRGSFAPTWNGKSVNLDGPADYSDLLHEFAHWQVAAKHRRRLVNYGLGSPDPYTHIEHNRHNSNIDERDEEQSSLLGIAYEAALGLEFTATLNDHAWWPYFSPRGEEESLALLQESAEGHGFWKFWRIIFTLQKRGLLTGHLPTGLLGDKKSGG